MKFPHFLSSFSIYNRNPGHWDISTSKEGRIYRIRGELDHVILIDERIDTPPNDPLIFKSLKECMSYLLTLLMTE